MNLRNLWRRAREFWATPAPFEPEHAATIWTLPVLAGNYLWAYDCSCGREETRLVDSPEEANGVTDLVACPGASRTYRDKPAWGRRFPETGVLRKPVNRYLNAQQGSEFMVATDGGYCQRTGVAGWGFVTGAGWCQSGSFETPVKGAVNRAELEAVVQAFGTFPHSASVCLYVDNKVVVDYVQAVLDSKKLIVPKWAAESQAERLWKLTKDRPEPIYLLWTRRDSHWLHRQADRLAYAAARPLEAA